MVLVVRVGASIADGPGIRHQFSGMILRPESSAVFWTKRIPISLFPQSTHPVLGLHLLSEKELYPPCSKRNVLVFRWQEEK